MSRSPTILHTPLKSFIHHSLVPTWALSEASLDQRLFLMERSSDLSKKRKKENNDSDPRDANMENGSPYNRRPPRRLRVAKLAVRIIATIFSVLGLIVVLCLLFDILLGSPGFYPLTISFWGLSIVWDTAEYITICVRKRPIHPGGGVAAEWIMFAGLLATTVVDFVLYTAMDWYSYNSHPGTTYIRVSEIITTILRCVLGIWESVDLSRRRKYVWNLDGPKPYDPVPVPEDEVYFGTRGLHDNFVDVEMPIASASRSPSLPPIYEHPRISRPGTPTLKVNTNLSGGGRAG